MTDKLESWTFSASLGPEGRAPCAIVQMVPTHDGDWTPYQKAADCVDAMQARILSLEAENERLRSGGDIAEMMGEIAALKAEIERLRDCENRAHAARIRRAISILRGEKE